MSPSIQHPNLLLIPDRLQRQTAFGCDQTWFPDRWQRQAGCGPCTAATVLFYLAQSREWLEHLYSPGSNVREDFIRFMKDIWHYVTPGSRGVNEASILANGVVRYAEDHEVHLAASVLNVPKRRLRHKPYDVLDSFIRQGLETNCPVAFLNLSNGSLNNLESWHWVTITELSNKDSSVGQAVISDSGRRKVIDLAAWYRSSLMGGAAVWFSPGELSQPGSESSPEANSGPG